MFAAYEKQDSQENPHKGLKVKGWKTFKTFQTNGIQKQGFLYSYPNEIKQKKHRATLHVGKGNNLSQG